MFNEHMRYIGVLSLLEECSVHVPEELRESIMMAFDDAVRSSEGGLKCKRNGDRVEIEVV